MATILASHHKHMKLVEPYTPPHVIACSVRKVFFRFVERKSRKWDRSV